MPGLTSLTVRALVNTYLGPDEPHNDDVLRGGGGGGGGRPVAKRFSCILEAPDGLCLNLLGPSSGGVAR